MFTTLPEDSVPVFSGVGIKLVLRIITAAAAFLLSFLSIGLIKKSRESERESQTFFLFYWFSLAAVLFFFVFGSISDYSRRIIPPCYFCLIADCVLIFRYLRGIKSTLLTRAVLSAAAGLGILVGVMNGISVFRSPIDTSRWLGQDTVTSVLSEHGLTFGYSTNINWANLVPVLTDGKIEVLMVGFGEDGGFINPHVQGDEKHYLSLPEDGRTFLIVEEYEFWAHPELQEDAVEILRASLRKSEYDAGYFILVYDHDPVREMLVNSQ